MHVHIMLQGDDWCDMVMDGCMDAMDERTDAMDWDGMSKWR